MCVSWTEGPVEIGMSLDIASIDAISEINMVHLLFLSSARSNEGAGVFMCFLYLFRTTQRQSSSVSAGVMLGWCSPVMRAWAWTVAWCHCSGSLTLSSQTPSAPSCTMSPWKIASYASSATELFSMLFGTFLYRSFDARWQLTFHAAVHRQEENKSSQPHTALMFYIKRKGRK